METKTLQDLRRHYKDLTAKLSELDAQVFPLRKRLNDVKMLIVQEIQGNLIRGRELYYLRGSKFVKVDTEPLRSLTLRLVSVILYH